MGYPGAWLRPCGGESGSYVGSLPPHHWAALQRKHFVFVVIGIAYHHTRLVFTFSTCLGHVGWVSAHTLPYSLPTPNALHMPQMPTVWVRTSLTPSPSTLTYLLMAAESFAGEGWNQQGQAGHSLPVLSSLSWISWLSPQCSVTCSAWAQSQLWSAPKSLI